MGDERDAGPRRPGIAGSVYLLALGGFITAATAAASWSAGEFVGMTLGWVASGVAEATITRLTLNKMNLGE